MYIAPIGRRPHRGEVGATGRRSTLALPFLVSALLVGAFACAGGEKVELPPLQPFQGEQAERVHQIRAKAVEVRGLLHQEFVEEGALTREALKEFFRQEAAKEKEEPSAELEATNIAWRLLHLIGPEDDLLDLSTESSGDAILGFYLSEEDRLVLIAGETEITPDKELTLAHEYFHSFQDKRFDLERLRKQFEREEQANVGTEYGNTIQCIVEGDATFAEYKYAEEVLGPDWQNLVSEEPTDTESNAEDYPVALSIYSGFPYSACANFVAYVYYTGGQLVGDNAYQNPSQVEARLLQPDWLAVNDLYEDPPKTTEQILHPEKYFTRDGARPLPFTDLSSQLGPNWEQMLNTAWGELDVIAYLVANLEDYDWASQVAEGWGGGRLAVYRREGDAGQQVVVQVAVNWDTDTDFGEFLVAQREILAGRHMQTEGDDILRQPGDLGWQPGVLRWQEEGEHGYVRWDPAQRRIDLLIAVDGSDLEAAVAALDGDHSA